MMRSLLLFSIFLLGATNSSEAQEKNVLFEKFTNAYCGVCPDATLNLMEIVKNNPSVVWISHHKPVTWTDNPLTNEQSIAIWDDLNVSGVPQGMVDRTVYNNDIVMVRSYWSGRVDAHIQKSTPFNITIEDVDYDANKRELSFDASTLVLSEATTNPYRITAYIVEDSVNTTEQHSYWNEVAGHPLEGRGKIIWDYYHRNVVRTILDSHWGTSEIVPDSPVVGESYNHRFSYTIPDEYRPHRMKIVVMVASFDEVNTIPKEVHDAAQIDLRDLDVKLTDTKDLATSNLQLYPNPSSDFIEVEFQQLPDNVMILDANGQVVLQHKPTRLDTRINIENFAPGSYYFITEIEGQLKGQIFGIVR